MNRDAPSPSPPFCASTAKKSINPRRKARLGEDAEEVEAHDKFINEVKAELTRIGVK